MFIQLYILLGVSLFYFLFRKCLNKARICLVVVWCGCDWDILTRGRKKGCKSKETHTPAIFFYFLFFGFRFFPLGLFACSLFVSLCLLCVHLFVVSCYIRACMCVVWLFSIYVVGYLLNNILVLLSALKLFLPLVHRLELLRYCSNFHEKRPNPLQLLRANFF